ncbi:hypothetical protein GCM10007047_17560 [Cerasicoccus arenae]|uniref:Uncharacterized protein n=1 Tax=Cerasicoccus arenae TaxID=424488 RepID=A0A8J3DC52_9BACT|nr:hypothetical protein GCM10007047_17560 [Cerasicoccus arenae]
MTIDSGDVVYTPGGDFLVGGGATYTMNGGSFIQATGNNWMKFGTNTVGDATLIFNSGSSFNAGTSARMMIGDFNRNTLFHVNGGTVTTNAINLRAPGTIKVSSGELNITAAFIESLGNFQIEGGTVNFSQTYAPTAGILTFSGGSVDITGQLQQAGADLTISGSDVSATLLSLAAASTINFTAGTITISGTTDNGITAGADGYLNFLTGSSGQLILENVDSGLAASLLTDRIRLDGAVNAGAFAVADFGIGGSSISLIPESSHYAIGFGFAVLAVGLIRRRQTK